MFLQLFKNFNIVDEILWLMHVMISSNYFIFLFQFSSFKFYINSCNCFLKVANQQTSTSE